MYHSGGQGAPQDYAEAAKWYRLAAEQGNAHAQFSLGAMNHEGRGTPQHYAEAMKWYRLAAHQGNALAQLAFGLMYANGRGVPQDYIEACKWFSLSAAQGNQDAAKSLGTSTSRMTPAQIVEAQKLARSDNVSCRALNNNALLVFSIFSPHFFGLVFADKPATRNNKLSSAFLVILDKPPNLPLSFFVWKPIFHIFMLGLHRAARSSGCHALLNVLQYLQF